MIGERESEVFARTGLIVSGCVAGIGLQVGSIRCKTLLTRYLRWETHKRKLKGCVLGRDSVMTFSGVVVYKPRQ